jgi:type II secretory pathway pseudopilin PulG
MKRLIFWLVALAIITLLVAMLLPAETGLPRNKNVRCKVVLRRLQAEINNYQNEFGSYPTGDCAQVLKKLFGDNPKKIEFLRPPNTFTNQIGEFLDPWGTPYAINFLSTNSFVISSAGKDKIFGDKDDIIFNSVSNDFVKP